MHIKNAFNAFLLWLEEQRIQPVHQFVNVVLGVFNFLAAQFSIEAVPSDGSSHDSGITDQLGLVGNVLNFFFSLAFKVEMKGLVPDLGAHFIWNSSEVHHVVMVHLTVALVGIED